MKEASLLQDVRPEVLRNLQDYLATHDARYLTEDVVYYNLTTGEEFRGRGKVSAMLNQIYHGSFDARLDVSVLFAHDNKAMVEASIRGKHVGDFNGIAATGKEVAIPLQAIYTLRDGLISEARYFLSLVELMRQLGQQPGSQFAQPGAPQSRTAFVVRDAFQLHFGRAREAKDLLVDAVRKGLIPNDTATRVFTDFTGDAYRLIMEKGFDSLGAYEQRLGSNLNQTGWQQWYGKFKPLVERSHREILRQVY